MTRTVDLAVSHLEFVLAGPGSTVRACGPALRVDVPAGPSLPMRASDAAARLFESSGGGPYVVGWLPFDTEREPAVLFRPRAAAVHDDLADVPEPSASVYRLTSDPPAKCFRESVVRAIAAIESSRVQKVVLSRSLVVEADAPFAPWDVVTRLRRAYPSCTAFVAGTMVGATPELLVSRRGAAVRSVPLAGTAPRSPDAATDAALRDDLASSAKELEEHRLVVEHVADRLQPFCGRLAVPSSPEALGLANVWHLATAIEGTLNDGRLSSLALAGLLHPTPAVCGTPARAAVDLIREAESRPRGLYAGVVGWMDASGDGDWMYALRCADIRGRIARCFAGAGIVAGSDPDAEVDETRAKLRALLDALVRP